MKQSDAESRVTRLLRFVGLIAGFVGIAFGLANQLGMFVNPERVALRDAIRMSATDIPRTAPGFEDFLHAFPPPAGIDPTRVTQIAKFTIQTADGFPVNITVRYMANGVPTAYVASYSDIERWAAHTDFGWWSLGVTFGGWLVVAVIELLKRTSRS